MENSKNSHRKFIDHKLKQIKIFFAVDIGLKKQIFLVFIHFHFNI